MKAAGIIAEYNPFHSGHGYHIEQTRKLTGADYIVVVMSGDFVQRGDPACADKYLRTRMALMGGADLVIELPVLYATASAEYFATAGVKLLAGLHCVDHLSFGSEWGSLEEYQPYVELFYEEEDPYRNLLQDYLRQGASYPSARSLAAGRILSEKTSGFIREEEADRFLKEPNHILGLEYLKALKREEPSMEPVAVLRQGPGYHDPDPGRGFSSATAIRKAVFEGTDKDLAINKLKPYLGPAADLFLEHIDRHEYVTWEDLMPLLDYAVLNLEEGCFGVDHELFQRIQKRYLPRKTLPEIVDILHTKNRTDAALRRALLHILLKIGKEAVPEYAGDLKVPYARVLGFRKEASVLLKTMRKSSDIPVIQRPAEGISLLKNSPGELILYQMDLRCADLYEQVMAGKCKRQAVRELSRQQVII